MIVKTGANYQAEGGYIEFAANNPNGTTIINGREVPTSLYTSVTSITGDMKVKVRKTPESTGIIRVLQYPEITSEEGVKFRDYANFTLTTTDNYIDLPINFGGVITVPSGMKPVLSDESKDVRLIHLSNTTYLFITGENPFAVLSYTEA